MSAAWTRGVLSPWRAAEEARRTVKTSGLYIDMAMLWPGGTANDSNRCYGPPQGFHFLAGTRGCVSVCVQVPSRDTAAVIDATQMHLLLTNGHPRTLRLIEHACAGLLFRVSLIRRRVVIGRLRPSAELAPQSTRGLPMP